MKYLLYTLFFTLVFTLLSCEELSKLPGANDTLFQNDSIIGYATDNRLSEVSGIAASYSNPGYFWVHNDSGDEASIYLIDSSASIVKIVTLSHARYYTSTDGINKIYVTDTVRSNDWEDISMQQDINGKNLILIGDVGDNNAQRNSVTIYRIEEPVFDGNTSTTIYVDAEKMILTYSDGKKDVEAMMSDPVTGNVILLTKREMPAIYYIFSFDNTTVEVAPSGSLPIATITGGDINANGDILLKSYWEVYLFQNKNKSSTQKIFEKGSNVTVNYKQEAQGEAICWGRGNASYFTLSEKQNDNAPPFYVYY